ncbi:MAG: 30S ribosomal protein S6 [Chloroflexi bacterium]|nr:30S ribosomal protein S6 [Chloroflexota bacterium]
MRDYETTYIIDSSVNEEAVPEIVEKYSKLVSDTGGQVDNIKEWGLRRMAFEINGKEEGFYITMRFHSTPDSAKEIGRQFRIADNIIRGIVVRYD